MAPEVMVEQVSAKANWNSQNARNATPVASYVAGASCRKSHWYPIKPFPWPNMEEKPHAKNKTPQRHVSTMHSMRTFTVSRDRQKPASSIVKPTCIPKTRKAATNVQTVLIGLMMSAALAVG